MKYVSIDSSTIYQNRMLIFLETSPQSNKYNQILLTPDEYKKVSASFGRPTGKNEGSIEEVEIQASVDEYTLPDLRDMV